MSVWLAPAHLALCLIIVVWDIVLGGRIARVAHAPAAFASLAGLAGLLVLPAFVVALASTTVITGRAILYVDWIWPAVLIVFAAQAVYALVRRLVNPAWGIPIAIYDVVIAVAGVVRYLAARGYEPVEPLLLLLTAQTAALSLATHSAAIANPLYINVPMIAPAFPALRPITATFRALLSALALGWSIGIAFQLPVAIKAVRSYHAHATDRLTERPEGDFSIGVKLFPDVGSPPPPPAVASDLALADTLTADVVAVVVVPDINNQVLDSLAHALDQLQRDSTLLIVTLGYRGKLLPELRRVPLDPRARIAPSVGSLGVCDPTSCFRRKIRTVPADASWDSCSSRCGRTTSLRRRPPRSRWTAASASAWRRRRSTRATARSTRGPRARAHPWTCSGSRSSPTGGARMRSTRTRVPRTDG